MRSLDSRFYLGNAKRSKRQRHLISVAIILLALEAQVTPVLGQSSPGSLDASFPSAQVASALESTSSGGRFGRIVVQPDKQILIADMFLSTAGVLLDTPLLRLSTDSSTIDSGFSPAGSGLCGVDRTGRIFSWVSDKGLVRLNSDGTLDPSFSPVPANALPLAAELSDGRIMAAVRRQADPRTMVETLERLSSNGIVDPSYVIQIASGYGISPVTALVATPDGGVVVGGDYVFKAFDANGQEDLRVKSLGTAGVWTIAIQPDGKLLAGGNANSAHGPLFRLNTDRTLDTGFTPQVDQNVYALALEPSGKILIGGSFQSVGGHPRQCVARLNADGSLDESFGNETNGPTRMFGPSNVGQVDALAVQPDGNILVGGDFNAVDGVPRTNMARLFGGELPGPPRVQIPPSDQVLVTGAPLKLQAWFSGSPEPAYQWLYNGASIAGATNSNLSIASVDATRAGTYRVVASNSFGAITSAVAQVSVLVPVSNPFVSNAVFQAAVVTETNQTYAAEYTDSLATPSWLTLTNFMGDGANRVFQDNLGSQARRFYRVRAW